jgi:hypothetical protein
MTTSRTGQDPVPSRGQARCSPQRLALGFIGTHAQGQGRETDTEQAGRRKLAAAEHGPAHMHACATSRGFQAALSDQERVNSWTYCCDTSAYVHGACRQILRPAYVHKLGFCARVQDPTPIMYSTACAHLILTAREIHTLIHPRSFLKKYIHPQMKLKSCQ